MSWLDKLENISVKFLSPVATGITALLGFIVTFDFSSQRARFPNWPRVFDFLEHPSVFWWLVFFVLLAFSLNLFNSFCSPTRNRLKRELISERQNLSEITDHVGFCLEGFIWEQAKRVGFTKKGISRISLYLHEPKKSRFFCLIRKSHNLELEKKGRTFFADNEGCIARAWQQDWHFDNMFPADDAEHARYQKENYGIAKQTSKNLTMKSMLIAAKKVVDKGDRPLALIVIESLEADAFDEAALRAALNGAAIDCANLLTVWKRHLPTPSAAQDEGF